MSTAELSIPEVVTLLQLLLAHGWGGVHVKAENHHIVTMHAELVVKTKNQVDNIVRLCYGQSAVSPIVPET